MFTNLILQLLFLKWIRPACGVPEAWPVACTCFFTKNMKPRMYMYMRPGRSQVPVFLPKIWSRACTCGLAGCRYMISHPKYEAGDVSATWPVADTCFPIQNMKLGMYLRPGRSQVPVFPPKMWSRACTWGLADREYLITHPRALCTCHRYLFSYPKYKARRVPATGTCFPTQNMKPSMYLRHGRLQVPVLPSRIWSASCTWGLASVSPILFSLFQSQKLWRRGSCANSWSSRFYIRVFPFPLVKIVARGQLCQQQRFLI